MACCLGNCLNMMKNEIVQVSVIIIIIKNGERIKNEYENSVCLDTGKIENYANLNI